jgi:hypothetical protein
VVMSPAGLGSESDCTGEDQLQFCTTPILSLEGMLYEDYNQKHFVGK